MFKCNLPSTLLAEWPGSFMCHCGNTEWNVHRLRVSSESELKRRKISRRSWRDSNSQPFDHESGTLQTDYPGKRRNVCFFMSDSTQSSTPVGCIEKRITFCIFYINETEAVSPRQRHGNRLTWFNNTFTISLLTPRYLVRHNLLCNDN